MKPGQFLKHAVVYALSSFLVQAAGLVLLPLYTRYLTPDDYGTLEILIRLGETVSALLVIGGMRLAVLALYQQCDSESERRRVVLAGQASLLACCVLAGGLALLLVGWITPWLQASGSAVTAGQVRLAVLCIVLEPLILIPLALMQARAESGRYALINLGMFLLRVGLCVTLVAGLGWGIEGVLTATATTQAIFGLTLSLRELRPPLAWPAWAQIAALWRFALPFLPGGLCFFVLHHGDRYLLLGCCRDRAEVGTYALGYKLAMIVGTFTMMPLHLVWSPRVYQAAREPDAPRLFGVVCTRILGAYLLLGLGLSLFRRELVWLLGGADYAPASAVIVPVVLACFLQSGATLMDSAFYIQRRTGLKLAVTVATTVVMIALYLLLIPTYRAQGAALATLGGFAFLAAATWWTTQRIFPVCYEWGRLAGLLALAAGLGLIGELLPDGPPAWLGKVGLWLLFPVLLWQTGLIRLEEKQYAWGIWSQTWNGIRRGARGFGWLSPRPQR